MSDPVQHPLIRPVRQGNAFEEAVERILDSIRLGLFRRGERLPPERETAALLGISRATLREALRELQAAGVLEVVRGRYGGTFVTGRTALPDEDLPRVDPAEVEDVIVFRAVVEPAAAELAARAALSAAARSHLRACLRQVEESPPEDYRPADARFHIAVAELGGCPSLVRAVAEVRSRASDLLDRIPVLPVNLEHSDRQHREIADAVLTGDAPAARAAALAHLEGTAALLRGFLGHGAGEAASARGEAGDRGGAEAGTRPEDADGGPAEGRGGAGA